MDFVTYARAHGILIDRLIDDGKWHRVCTTSHPAKKNGAYRYCGTHGHVQDHATMLEPELWTPDADQIANIDHAGIARRSAEAAAQIRHDQDAAAKKAGWVLHQCKPELHPYLEAKGFPEEYGQVWMDGDVRKLCIPMRVDGRVVGLQTISDKDGFEKRFLYGQRTSEATYIIDNRGPVVLAEGYATCLSVRVALQAIKTRYKLICCFSAGNLAKIAKNYDRALVIADNDASGTGERVARESGHPYWMSDQVGEDANDCHMRVGTFRFSQQLKQVLIINRRIIA